VTTLKKKKKGKQLKLKKRVEMESKTGFFEMVRRSSKQAGCGQREKKKERVVSECVIGRL
jgi:hypothetical protein